jgi:hypothetical protein
MRKKTYEAPTTNEDNHCNGCPHFQPKNPPPPPIPDKIYLVSLAVRNGSCSITTSSRNITGTSAAGLVTEPHGGRVFCVEEKDYYRVNIERPSYTPDFSNLDADASVWIKDRKPKTVAAAKQLLRDAFEKHLKKIEGDLKSLKRQFGIGV